MWLHDPPITPTIGEVTREPGRRKPVSSVSPSSVSRPAAEQTVEPGAEFGRLQVLSINKRDKTATLINKTTRKLSVLLLQKLRLMKRTDPEWKLRAECVRLRHVLDTPEWRDTMPIAIWRNAKLQLRADYEPRAHEVLVMTCFTPATTATELFLHATKGLDHD